ncbi:hypothetical protein KW818_01335 [Enterobacter quasiroggenkampii]|uniref:hypothetical protein n=1 Tax=Enterobacter quasiroggenkampii TaxID=2497436 RepID=UPI0021D245DE|nr:hypothetical protein [Enterobacter quasiroggenkampii]MCU6387761.1 hypothetical protein [Enterobacter quasiroggenkampii]
MFLSHFRKWGSYGKYDLLFLNHDISGTTRYIYVDLTNQALSQVNYLNDLITASQHFGSQWFFVNVNAVSQSLRQNIPANLNVHFIDASLPPIRNDDGYEFFYCVYEPEMGDEPYGYVPQANLFMSVSAFEHYDYI